MKRALRKSIGRGLLSWAELSEVVLDVEVALSGRPLGYVEEDVQMPTLTPNSSLYTQTNLILELEAHHVKDCDLRKRARYLQRCKQVLWSRWTNEYLRGLREKYTHRSGKLSLAVGDVVVIKSDERNRGEWPLGIVDELIKGRDGVVRAAKLRAGKGVLERAVQHLYPLELSCDRRAAAPRPVLNTDAPVFKPQRDAGAAARLRMQEIATNNELIEGRY